MFVCTPPAPPACLFAHLSVSKKVPGDLTRLNRWETRCIYMPTGRGLGRIWLAFVKELISFADIDYNH